MKTEKTVQLDLRNQKSGLVKVDFNDLKEWVKLTLPYINHKEWKLDIGIVEIYNIPEELEDQVVRFVFNEIEIQNLKNNNLDLKNQIWN